MTCTQALVVVLGRLVALSCLSFDIIEILIMDLDRRWYFPFFKSFDAKIVAALALNLTSHYGLTPTFMGNGKGQIKKFQKSRFLTYDHGCSLFVKRQEPCPSEQSHLSSWCDLRIEHYDASHRLNGLVISVLASKGFDLQFAVREIAKTLGECFNYGFAITVPSKTVTFYGFRPNGHEFKQKDDSELFFRLGQPDAAAKLPGTPRNVFDEMIVMHHALVDSTFSSFLENFEFGGGTSLRTMRYVFLQSDVCKLPNIRKMMWAKSLVLSENPTVTELFVNGQGFSQAINAQITACDRTTELSKETIVSETLVPSLSMRAVPAIGVGKSESFVKAVVECRMALESTLRNFILRDAADHDRRKVAVNLLRRELPKELLGFSAADALNLIEQSVVNGEQHALPAARRALHLIWKSTVEKNDVAQTQATHLVYLLTSDRFSTRLLLEFMEELANTLAWYQYARRPGNNWHDIFIATSEAFAVRVFVALSE